MYRGFNLEIGEEDFIFEEEKSLSRYEQTGRKRLHYLHENTEDVLNNYVSEGIIDGTGLSERWFQRIKSDIFLSHSHKDTRLAYILSGWMETNFGVKVFIDETIWGSADRLLKKIDDEYCRINADEGNYEYKKRNLSTSHVHAMLSVAIWEVIDRTEIVIFLNTDNSIPKIKNSIDGNDDCTLSPWLYEELMTAKLVEKKDWKDHRLDLITEYASMQLNVSYKLPLENLTGINMQQLYQWCKEYKKSKDVRNNIYGGLLEKNPDHPLNYLYSMIFGFQNKERDK